MLLKGIQQHLWNFLTNVNWNTILYIITIIAILSVQADFWKFFYYLFKGKGHKTQYKKKPHLVPTSCF